MVPGIWIKSDKVNKELIIKVFLTFFLDHEQLFNLGSYKRNYQNGGHWYGSYFRG